jgi:hypothetical protein
MRAGVGVGRGHSAMSMMTLMIKTNKMIFSIEAFARLPAQSTEQRRRPR